MVTITFNVFRSLFTSSTTPSSRRRRYSRTRSSVVTSPLVSAACNYGTVFSNTLKVLVVAGFAATDPASIRQLTICERCRGERPRKSGSATSFFATSVTRAISDPAAGMFGDPCEYGASLFGATRPLRIDTGKPRTSWRWDSGAASAASQCCKSATICW